MLTGCLKMARAMRDWRAHRLCVVRAMAMRCLCMLHAMAARCLWRLRAMAACILPTRRPHVVRALAARGLHARNGLPILRLHSVASCVGLTLPINLSHPTLSCIEPATAACLPSTMVRLWAYDLFSITRYLIHCLDVARSLPALGHCAATLSVANSLAGITVIGHRFILD